MNEIQTITAVIPARMGSSRFPGKPLAPLLGIPMVEHVYHRTAQCPLIDEVYVATCDEAIRERVEHFGGRVLMTASTHIRASDRVAEAAERLESDIIVLIQGDEPMVTPGMISQAVEPMLHDRTIACVNLAGHIESEADFRDPNTVKVVMAKNGNALYFSREPIPSPWQKSHNAVTHFKQICVIPFRRDTLCTYATLEPTPLEVAESIDMLRFLEHGYIVRMVETETMSYPVDVVADVERVERALATDPLTQSYLSINVSQ